MTKITAVLLVLIASTAMANTFDVRAIVNSQGDIYIDVEPALAIKAFEVEIQSDLKFVPSDDNFVAKELSPNVFQVEVILDEHGEQEDFEPEFVARGLDDFVQLNVILRWNGPEEVYHINTRDDFVILELISGVDDSFVDVLRRQENIVLEYESTDPDGGTSLMHLGSKERVINFLEDGRMSFFLRRSDVTEGRTIKFSLFHYVVQGEDYLDREIAVKEIVLENDAPDVWEVIFPAITPSAVAPSNKLVTTWGRVKS